MTRWHAPPTELCIENEINSHTDHRAETVPQVLSGSLRGVFLSLLSGIS